MRSLCLYSQLSLIYLSKQVHLQSALSVGYRQADINKALGLSGSLPDELPEGQLILWFCDSFFSHFSRITMRDMLGELASLSALSVRQFFFFSQGSQAT